MPTKPSNNDILTQLQIDMATTKGEVKNLSDKVDDVDKKIETGFLNLKGYVPSDIYKLHMDAQKIVNDNHNTRIEAIETFVKANNNGIEFSNNIIKNILKTLAYVAGAGLVIGGALLLIKNSGGM